MLDGFLIYNLLVNIIELYHNNQLLFNCESKNHDEIKKEFATYKGQTFTIIENKVQLRGSFHTYFNDGLHNYNDFTFNNFKNVLIEFSTKFNINLNTILNNLEFGVNIYIPVPPAEVFKNIISYKRNIFIPFNIKDSKGISCDMQRFYIKIYDKGYHKKQPGYLLRFEIKVKKMEFFKQNYVNIKSLSDLLDINNLYPLKGILIRVFNDILFTDYNINKDVLTAKERELFIEGNNPIYWKNINPSKKNCINANELKNKRNFYDRELIRFKNLIQKYSTINLQKNISILIDEKCNQLLNIENKKRGKLTDIAEELNIKEKRQINTLSIVLNYSNKENQKQRLCLTCKKDISHKKRIAKYCSKKCKNDYTNPILSKRNNLLRSIKNLNSTPVLFDNSQYIQLSANKQDLLTKKNSIYN